MWRTDCAEIRLRFNGNKCCFGVVPAISTDYFLPLPCLYLSYFLSLLPHFLSHASSFSPFIYICLGITLFLFLYPFMSLFALVSFFLFVSHFIFIYLPPFFPFLSPIPFFLVHLNDDLATNRISYACKI